MKFGSFPFHSEVSSSLWSGEMDFDEGSLQSNLMAVTPKCYAWHLTSLDRVTQQTGCCMVTFQKF